MGGIIENSVGKRIASEASRGVTSSAFIVAVQARGMIGVCVLLVGTEKADAFVTYYATDGIWFKHACG